MQTIVTNGLKIDLHIHSCMSAHKDGNKVKNNTFERIPVLVEKLSEQKVNICSITDHDVFSYDMYKALKKAEQDDSSIQKVLPGVEFSVAFVNRKNEKKVIHVITIFDDRDDKKIQKIESILNSYKKTDQNSYSEEEFLKILREVDIDTILIAHQKNTLSSSTVKKNDANSLGNEQFLEFVFSDYFEAFEFKNKRNEILNKNYLMAENLDEKVRFVTGTDCHNWDVYPRENTEDKLIEFPYTYAKCLPTFRGLVMAVTDVNRIRQVDSFFNVDKFVLDSLEFTSKNKKIKIPLSRGINVIIGDNSIGKSLFLHAATGYEKEGLSLDNGVKKGYKNYLKTFNLKIEKQIEKCNIFQFDMQGEVRKRFEENALKTSDFLSKNFPQDIDPKPYKTLMENEIDRLVSFLKKKFALDSEIEKLHLFKIYDFAESPESLIFQKNLRREKERTDSNEKIITELSQIIISFDKLKNLKLDKEDTDFFVETKKRIEQIKRKYVERNKKINTENERIELVANIIDNISKKHNRSISDNQKNATSFEENTELLKNALRRIIQDVQELGTYTPQIETIEITPNSNHIHNYEFITKFYVDRIDLSYFDLCLKSVLKANVKTDWNTVTEDKLREKILKYDETVPVLEFLKREFMRKVESDFRSKRTIINEGMDKYAELSAGMDAQMYFDLLSYETTRDGIYIIDQPEDNVSQTAIKTYLLEYFKNMGENRQVILVTHNPLFIVNLDIDNLIFLSKSGDELTVQSGALEYECEDYKILDIVAKNIDGGLDSIQKRWKRYEKINNI